MDRRILSGIFLICLALFVIVGYMQTGFGLEGRWGFVAMLGENYVALAAFIIVAVIVLGIGAQLSKRK